MENMGDTQDTSLKQAFAQAKYNQQSLDNLDPRSLQFRSIIDSAIQQLQACQKLIQDISLFSPNEELEDISTQNIQFLTVDYLLADLLLKSYDESRLASLNRSTSLLDGFLNRLDQYSLLSSPDRKLYEQYQENKAKFSLVSSSSPEERRRLKISRFQEEKQLKKKLEVSCRFSIALNLH